MIVKVTIDPKLPIAIRATFDTPLIINAQFFVREAGSQQWTPFFSSHVSEDVPTQVVESLVGPYKKDTSLLFTAVFSGATQTDFRTAITLSQDGAQVGKTITLNGSTGAKNAKYAEQEVDLV